MIEFVREEESTWNVLPHKFEAGTPNVGDAVGLAAACDYLDGIGLDTVLEHERTLVRLTMQRLREVDGVCLYGPPPSERSGVVSFTVAGIHPHDLATIFDQDGVCIRAGQHCAQPLMRWLGVSATARASFYVYNDERDVEALVQSLRRAKEVFAGGESLPDELPAHAARELAADREPQPRALGGAGERRLELNERLEDRADLAGLDADARVVHMEPDPITVDVGGEGDPAA